MTSSNPNINKMDTKLSMNWKSKGDFSLAFFTYLEVQGQREVLNWCMNLGLISASYECPKCDNCMKLVERKDNIDGYEWRCRKQGGEMLHDVARSVRKGSFLSKSKLSVCDILRIIRLWFGRSMLEFVMKEVNVANHAVVDWFKFCREVCTVDIINESLPIGGEELTVEVVECQLRAMTHVKEHFLNSNCDWIIAGIERGTNRCFFRAVNDRTKEEFLTVISEWVLPGSVVLSDCFNMYDCLSDENFVELSINNKLTFKTPSSNKNDTAIEPVWLAVQRFLRNTSNHVQGEFDSYLGEYLWRKKHSYSMSDNVFKAFLLAIVNVYNPPGRDLPP